MVSCEEAFVLDLLGSANDILVGNGPVGSLSALTRGGIWCLLNSLEG